MASRCTCISTIIRNLSFIPGNDLEMCANPTLLKIFSRLLIFKHTHPYISFGAASSSNCGDTVAATKASHDSDDGDGGASESESDMSDSDEGSYLQSDRDVARRLHIKYNLFYSKASNKVGATSDSISSIDPECIFLLRENTLVSIANISGCLNLSQLGMFSSSLI